MSVKPLQSVVQNLCRFAQADSQNAADGVLLRAFVTEHSETAFAQLVQRHGPMVLGVCRRVLDNRQDAEDAFQAAFLVLARKAASVQPPDLVGNWLYGVAYRTALEARSRALSRRTHEKQVLEMPQPVAAEDRNTQELRQVLDQELSRLPDKYRSAVVLCELEGRTRKEAAALLKIPEGTLSSRLALARKKLAVRLTARGLALTAGAVAAVLADEAACAAVPHGLMNVALRAGTGAAGMSANSVAIAEGVIKTMLLQKLTATAVCTLAFLLATVVLTLVAAAGFSPPEDVGQSKTNTQTNTRQNSQNNQNNQNNAANVNENAAHNEAATQSLPAFTKIHLKQGHAIIRQTGKETVALKNNPVPNARGEATVQDGSLQLHAPTPDGQFIVEVKNLASLDIEGTGKVEISNLQSKKLELRVLKPAQVVLSGQVEEQIYRVAAGAQLDAEACRGVQATIEVGGGSRALVNVAGQLHATVAAGGQLEYLGSPQVVRNVRPGGSLSQRAAAAAAREPAAPGTARAVAVSGVRIFFNSDRNGDYEIYAMDADGRNLDRLTTDPGYDLWPAPSPEGKKVAWMTNRTGDYEIHVMNADGSDPVNITRQSKSEEGHPTWSPDGKTIAFTSDRDGDMELYLMNADGSGWRRLTSAKGSDGLPTFSPDGQQIVFVSERDSNHELYRINIDGTELTRLTDHPGLDTMPAWSPDGKTIAFASDRDGGQALFLMNQDGGDVRRLAGPRSFAGWPDWSPDGSRLCCHALIRDHFTICLVEAATGRVEELTRARGANRNPRFGRLAAEPNPLPSIPDGGVRVAASVSGYLRSGAAGPNPQKYPFRYRGFGILSKGQAAELASPGAVPASTAQALAQALLWPGASDSLQSAKLHNADGKLTGEAAVLHKYGKQGTHLISARIEGAVNQGKLELRAVMPEISGTWDWGGGIARQEGEVEIQFEVQTSGSHDQHSPLAKNLPTEKQTPVPAPDQPNEHSSRKAGLTLTAEVDGFTQATMFNTQKYPFKYTGASVLTVEELRSLSRPGEVSQKNTAALVECLLWPKMGDTFRKMALKSDGKKLIGEVEILHKYGTQGTHVLRVPLEGTIEDNGLVLRAVNPVLSGTWDYGGGVIQLGGQVKISITAR